MPEIEIHPLVIEEETGPYGAKGFGEVAGVPTAPAIADAIEDAIGIRFTTIPIKPEHILAALEAAREQAQG
jgi:CO/xanthine dehydrogenase Mo-binding subunit